MGRRGLVVAAAAAVVLVVLAASSGPVRIWTTPTAEIGPAVVDTTASSEPIAHVEITVKDTGGGHGWNGALVQVVGILVLLAAIFGLVGIGTSARPHWRWLVWRRRGGGIAALPEVAQHELTVDVDAARDALATGAPRDAIVACWMQLERDAAAAGLTRAKAETSAEYVERVVALSSVDPIPIGELAALYREARFSRHDLTDDHRSRAYAALNRVAAALRRGVKVAT
ncbi:MAG TPA: DUF4129 domain-containing protein [Ilumatobacteraceae bacterium]|jgi:hypothetical protein